MVFNVFIIEKKFSESKSRVCNAMVHNPIYDGDGPVYESVQNREETQLPADTIQSTEPTDRQYDSLHVSTPPATSALQSDTTLNTVRYVDQPLHLHGKLFVHTKTSPSDSDAVSIPRSTSVSIPPARVMALKKNGQERNKLHLTLSLGGSGTNHFTGEVVPRSPPNASSVLADGDEAYTVMSPAGSLCRSLNSRHACDEVLAPEETVNIKH